MSLEMWAIVKNLCISGAIALLFLIPSSTQAEDTDLIIVGWLDHLTYGGVNTAIGVPLAIGTSIADGKVPSLRLSSTHSQIKVGTAVPGQGYSTGMFYHESNPGLMEAKFFDAHEDGHGKQSGVLGPLYLPMVGLSYLFQSHDNSLPELWADAWADLGSTMVDERRLQLRLGLRKEGGITFRETQLAFEPFERSSQVQMSSSFHGSLNPARYRISYLPLRAYVSQKFDDSSSCATNSTRVETALFERDFAVQFTILPQLLSLVLDGKQNTGRVSIDIERKDLDANFLSQAIGVGALVGDPRKIALEIVGRGSARIKGAWDWKSGPKRLQGVELVGGYEGETRLHLLDTVQVFAKHGGEVGTSRYRQEVTTVGTETIPHFKKNAISPKDTPTHLQAGIEISEKKDQVPLMGGGTQIRSIKLLLLTVGGRF